MFAPHLIRPFSGLERAYPVGLMLVFGLTACGSEQLVTAPESEARASLAAAALAPNTWTAKTSKPTHGSLMQAATVGNLIYVVGGLANYTTPSRVVEVYNVATNSWSPRKQLPAARYAANGATPLNGKIYVTGGFNLNFNLTRSFFVYDIASNSWARKADLPVSGACGAQGVINGQFYVYVGCTMASNGHRLLRYNSAVDRWVTLRPPNTVHKGAASGVIGGKLYLAGGDGNTNAPNLTTEVYNPATNSWASRAAPPQLLNSTSTGVLNKKLYIAGGMDPGGTTPVTTLRVYNPSTNAWSTRAPMPSAHWRGAGAVAGGLLFVIDGATDGSGVVHGYTP